jgi:hypothetical protein
MQLWGKSKENSAGTGGEFEEAAARVTVGSDEEVSRNAAEMVDAVSGADRLEIRPEWAQAAARLCFLPAARLSHPAYALTDEEAETISPQIQALLQAVADKYAPALVGRVANKHPELFDAAAALGVLYWQKWRLVSRLQEMEAAERAAAAAKIPPAPSSIELPGVSLPLRPQAGERDADGIRVI